MKPNSFLSWLVHFLRPSLISRDHFEGKKMGKDIEIFWDFELVRKQNKKIAMLNFILIHASLSLHLSLCLSLHQFFWTIALEW